LSTHPDTHERIAKLQKDVEEIREELEDDWHDRRSQYEQRVKKVLQRDENCTALYLEIDGIRSIAEIQRDLARRKQAIPQPSLWRAARRLVRGGLVRKTGTKGKSPVYSKKPWAITLDIEDYVRTKMNTAG
jgi:predicted Zn-dependent protease